MGERVFEWVMDHVMPWLLVVLIAVLVLGLVALGAAMVQEARYPSPSFTLKKADWTCVQSQTTTVIVMQPIGANGTLIPMPVTDTQCVLYGRK